MCGWGPHLRKWSDNHLDIAIDGINRGRVGKDRGDDTSLDHNVKRAFDLDVL